MERLHPLLLDKFTLLHSTFTNLQNARNKMATTQDEGTLTRIKRGDEDVKNDIISVFEQKPRYKPNGNPVTGFRYPKQDHVAWVKFGPLEEIAAEVKNHEYAFRALKEMPADQTRGIRIPEIYNTFNLDLGEELYPRMFIIMEYIDGTTLAKLMEEHGYELTKSTYEGIIARAIRLLMSIEAPKNQGPGPVGGGRIRHPLFKDETSYLVYSDVDALENHLNQVCNKHTAVALQRTPIYQCNSF